MKLLHVIAGVLVAVTAAGCTPTAPEPVAPNVSGTGASTGTLAAKLLTEADVPAGYKSAPIPSLGSDVSSVNGCPALAIRPSSATAPEASAAFAGGAVGSFLTE